MFAVIAFRVFDFLISLKKYQDLRQIIDNDKRNVRYKLLPKGIWEDNYYNDSYLSPFEKKILLEFLWKKYSAIFDEHNTSLFTIYIGSETPSRKN